MLKPGAVVGLFAANSVGDDIEVTLLFIFIYVGKLYEDYSRKVTLGTIYGLRQQILKDDNEPYLCVSDFVAPKTSGVVDHIGFLRPLLQLMVYRNICFHCWSWNATVDRLLEISRGHRRKYSS